MAFGALMAAAATVRCAATARNPNTETYQYAAYFSR